MITKVFSVYDSKSLCYGVPFFMPSTGAAVRAFSELANDSQSIVSRHGGDFVLYQIGVFDDSTAVLTSLIPQVQLGIGLDFQLKINPVVYKPAALAGASVGKEDSNGGS